MPKLTRHSKILKIIDEKDIETQEELADELRNEGIEITQATISRDIRELRLIKVLAASGIYKYASMEYGEGGITKRLGRIFAETVISIESAGNLMVVKTLVASAQAAASAIDACEFNEILGCIAGDDTILVVVKDAESVAEIIEKFNEMMRVKIN